MVKRMLVFYSVIFLFLVGIVSPAEAASGVPKIFGKYAMVIDAKTGEVIYSKESQSNWYPASTTKILTAMLLMDYVKPGTILTASINAVKQDESNPYFLLKTGEKMSRDEALKALLIMSCNDVATMIAEHIAGSEAKFSSLMNKKAKEIGAKNSHFVTPNGLHHSKHYTTPFDMALLTREAYLKYPQIVKTMGTKSATVQTSKRKVKLTSRAQYFNFPYVIGGKTGYTDTARNSLVEIVKKNGVTLIGVVLKSSKKEEYKDLSAITNYSFSMMKKIEAVKKGQYITTIKIGNSSIPLITENAISYTAKKDSKQPVIIKTTFPQNWISYIAKGEQFGEVVVLKNGVRVGSSPLIASKSSEEETASIKFVKEIQVSFLVCFKALLKVF
ncbi:D-alanyl-D-alanine carboxypeptidase family protein [Metabacillus sp. RGM 3146]|uniref:D-alanyl-D-alanine carboxypeptidase family protein n=1 Tax=Metabacillus sp. RGM 3146 TaxID=3401092 RepID=UPI003B9B87AD